VSVTDKASHPYVPIALILIQIVVMPVLGWTLTTVVEQGNEIAALKAQNSAMVDDIKDIKKGVNDLRQFLMQRPGP
jgi:hypothetical protein